MSIILGLRKLRQEQHKFEASLGYTWHCVSKVRNKMKQNKTNKKFTSPDCENQGCCNSDINPSTLQPWYRCLDWTAPVDTSYRVTAKGLLQSPQQYGSSWQEGISMPRETTARGKKNDSFLLAALLKAGTGPLFAYTLFHLHTVR